MLGETLLSTPKHDDGFFLTCLNIRGMTQELWMKAQSAYPVEIPRMNRALEQEPMQSVVILGWKL